MFSRSVQYRYRQILLYFVRPHQLEYTSLFHIIHFLLVLTLFDTQINFLLLSVVFYQVVAFLLVCHFRLLSSLAPCTDDDSPSNIERAVCKCFTHICASLRWLLRFGFTSTFLHKRGFVNKKEFNVNGFFYKVENQLIEYTDLKIHYKALHAIAFELAVLWFCTYINKLGSITMKLYSIQSLSFGHIVMMKAWIFKDNFFFFSFFHVFPFLSHFTICFMI